MIALALTIIYRLNLDSPKLRFRFTQTSMCSIPIIIFSLSRINVWCLWLGAGCPYYTQPRASCGMAQPAIDVFPYCIIKQWVSIAFVTFCVCYVNLWERRSNKNTNTKIKYSINREYVDITDVSQAIPQQQTVFCHAPLAALIEESWFLQLKGLILWLLPVRDGRFTVWPTTTAG